MNVSKLSLASLRDRIAAGTREDEFLHNSKADGSGTTVTSKAIYIPKFRVPANLWDNGQFPYQDLKLGGFLFDKYQASQPDATNTSRGSTTPNTPGLTAAVSQQGVVPWTDISQTNALIAASNRKTNGRAWHLPDMKEWATICFLIKLMGHDIRGNNNWGRDYRDPDSFEYYGIEDPVTDSYATGLGKEMARVLTGSGPASWAHNGMANGIFDIVGNMWEWLDFTIDCGRYQAIKLAAINDIDGITVADSAIVIDGVQNPSLWPAANGVVLIKAEGVNTDEYIIYTAFINNGNGTYTLTGCQRGQKGTAASAHADNAIIQQLTDYCVIPGGWTAKTSDAGLNNTTNPTTFAISDMVSGPSGAVPTINDVLQCETEQLIVTAVAGGNITVSRGANGSTIAVHAQGKGVARISPQMTNDSASSTDATYGSSQYGKFLTMRNEPELAALGLPLTVSSGGSEEWKDGSWLNNKGLRAALRGGSCNDACNARSGFALYLSNPPSLTNISVGLRAALSL